MVITKLIGISCIGNTQDIITDGMERVGALANEKLISCSGEI